jgi:hypothetical protein
LPGKELAAQNSGHDSPHFEVIEEGERRNLSPIFKIEVFRMARELLKNASSTRAHVKLKQRFATMIVHFVCVYAMMGEALIRKCLRRAGDKATGGCPAYASALSRSARNWIFGVKPTPVRKFS